MLRSAYVVGGRVPEVLLTAFFLFSLLASLYLSNYLLVSVVGLVVYAYAVLAGHAVLAFAILLTSLPFQVLVAGSHAIHLIAYYSALLVLRSLVYLRNSYFVLVPALVPVLAYLTLFHPIVEVPPLHYLMVCCVALLAGYFLRATEELISFGTTYIEVPGLDLTQLLSVGRILNTLALAYVVPSFSASLFFILMFRGLAFTQSLLASAVAGFLIVVLWLSVHALVLRLSLVLASTAFLVVAGGSWLLSVFDESLRLFEEVLRYFG